MLIYWHQRGGESFFRSEKYPPHGRRFKRDERHSIRSVRAFARQRKSHVHVDDALTCRPGRPLSFSGFFLPERPTEGTLLREPKSRQPTQGSSRTVPGSALFNILTKNYRYPNLVKRFKALTRGILSAYK